MMDKLFGGSDAHLLQGNAELIQRLRDGLVSAETSCEAADALEAAGKRIAELEAAIIGWKADQKENMATAVEECKRANEAERKLAVARAAMVMAVEMIETVAHERRHVRWKLKDARAQIGGDDAAS